MGQASARRARRLVGGDNFHPFAPNVHSRESGGGGYVASVVCHAGALGRMGTGNKYRASNIERRTSNSIVVDHLLRFVGVGVSGQGADWVDAVVNGCDCPRICSPGRLCGAFQIRPRRFIDVGAGLSLGNSSAPSNTWGIFPSRDWETRSRAFDRDHGRTWRVIHLDVSGTSSFLFHHSFREFFSVVDQTGGALEKPAQQWRWH